MRGFSVYLSFSLLNLKNIIMNADFEKANAIWAEADCLHTEATILQAIQKIAENINQQLADTPVVCLTVMTGGLMFAGQLLTRLKLPLFVDYVHASRYGGATVGGTELTWTKRPSINLREHTVLILDDILDEGVTLQAIVEFCQHAGAKQVLTAVLVEKELPHRKGLAKADFVGLTVPNRYVFGYGMDYQEYLRHLPAIYAVKGS